MLSEDSRVWSSWSCVDVSTSPRSLAAGSAGLKHPVVGRTIFDEMSGRDMEESSFLVDARGWGSFAGRLRRPYRGELC